MSEMCVKIKHSCDLMFFCETCGELYCEHQDCICNEDN